MTKVVIGNCLLIHGDCLEVLPTLEAGSVDAVVTDPPYGIELGKDNNQSRDGSHLAKGAYVGYADTYEQFISEIIPRLNAAIRSAQRACVFTGPHITEQLKPDAIGGVYCPGALGRTPWGSKEFLPLLLYGTPSRNAGQHRPMVLRDSSSSEKCGHPCPKPLKWMLWVVKQYSEPDEAILDPFMGSGTTGVACIKTNRKFIGIEKEKAYFDIACRRIRAAYDETALFNEVPAESQAVLIGGVE